MTRASYGNRQKYESRNPIQRALIARFGSQLLRIAERLAPRTILDVGCGEGYMLAVLQRGGIEAELNGVDLSADAISVARSRLGEHVSLEVRDARDLADEGRTFDLVMMLEVLEHMERPEAMMPILDQLTAGHLLVSVPWEPFFRGLNLLRGKHVRAWGNDPEHVNHWSRRGFLRFVGQRFEVVEAPLVFPWTMALLRRGS